MKPKWDRFEGCASPSPGASSSVPQMAQQTANGDLLELYDAGDPVFFASSQQTLLVRRQHVVGAHHLSLDDALVSQTEHLLVDCEARRGPGALLIGSLPFERGASSRLWLTHRPHRQASRAEGRPAGPAAARSSPLRLRPSYPGLTEAGYVATVARALQRIARGELDKVVLSRSVSYALSRRLDPVAFVRRLAARCPSAYLTAMQLPTGLQEEPCTLIAASPELLLQKAGGRVITHPLAGSRPRGGDPQTDEAHARQLLRSKKDLHEHGLVTEAVVSALRPFCSTLRVPAAPSLVGTPTMWHLATRIEGQLQDPRCSSIALAAALHPTPAVCGSPTAAAAAAIAELEGQPRGAFAGAFGYCDANGDGEWAVTLRCLQAFSDRVVLHAGAGIVAGSEPELELQETSHKLSTLLQVLGECHVGFET